MRAPPRLNAPRRVGTPQRLGTRQRLNAPRRASLAFVLLAAAAGISPTAVRAAVSGHAPRTVADPCPHGTTLVLAARGATLCASIDDADLAGKQALLREWIERSAGIVADYYARFPAPLVVLRIQGTAGEGVHGGRTTNESQLEIQVSVGHDVTAGQLTADWVLVHEMIHLALPELGRRHDWLAEGLATYVEGIARAQSGNRDVADVWAEYRRSMPRGLPQAGEGGMDQTRSWGRTYWGGALYCLQSDVAIRERTGNRIGLQAALRAILNETGGYRSDRGIDEVLRIGDSAVGTGVLEDLYQRIKDTAMTPDLDLLWSRLGVPEDPKSQPFDDRAPLAAVRIAITARPVDRR
jgi:hypothetical protein